MNREIKYKYWYSGKMLDVWQIEFFTNGSITVNGELVGGILLQYTGLKDKNGTEIYEGYIVETAINNEAFKHVVKFGDTTKYMHQDGYYGWYCEPIDTDSIYCQLNPSIEHTSKVIGNIYQNPELINS